MNKFRTIFIINSLHVKFVMYSCYVKPNDASVPSFYAKT
jgi:hypothetical protein